VPDGVVVVEAKVVQTHIGDYCFAVACAAVHWGGVVVENCIDCFSD
jgi:hypothetical protein